MAACSAHHSDSLVNIHAALVLTQGQLCCIMPGHGYGWKSTTRAMCPPCSLLVLLLDLCISCLQGGKLLTWAALGYGVFHILFLLYMRPSILDFLFWVIVGGGIGAAGAYGFYQTKHFKRQLNAGVRSIPPNLPPLLDTERGRAQNIKPAHPSSGSQDAFCSEQCSHVNVLPSAIMSKY